MHREEKQLKVDLYLSLLNKTNEELTDEEVDIMYLLAKDKDIQQLLNDSLKDIKLPLED